MKTIKPSYDPQAFADALAAVADARVADTDRIVGRG